MTLRERFLKRCDELEVEDGFDKQRMRTALHVTEETSEFIQAVSHWVRKRHGWRQRLIKEMIDVDLQLWKLRQRAGISEAEYEVAMTEKVESWLAGKGMVP